MVLVAVDEVGPVVGGDLLQRGDVQTAAAAEHVESPVGAVQRPAHTGLEGEVRREIARLPGHLPVESGDPVREFLRCGGVRAEDRVERGQHPLVPFGFRPGDVGLGQVGAGMGLPPRREPLGEGALGGRLRGTAGLVAQQQRPDAPRVGERAVPVPPLPQPCGPRTRAAEHLAEPVVDRLRDAGLEAAQHGVGHRVEPDAEPLPERVAHGGRLRRPGVHGRLGRVQRVAYRVLAGGLGGEPRRQVRDHLVEPRTPLLQRAGHVAGQAVGGVRRSEHLGEGRPQRAAGLVQHGGPAGFGDRRARAAGGRSHGLLLPGGGLGAEGGQHGPAVLVEVLVEGVGEPVELRRQPRLFGLVAGAQVELVRKGAGQFAEPELRLPHLRGQVIRDLGADREDLVDGPGQPLLELRPHMLADRGDDLRRHLVRKGRAGGGQPPGPRLEAPLERGPAPRQGGLAHGLLGEVGLPHRGRGVLGIGLGDPPVVAVLPDAFPDLVELLLVQPVAAVGRPRVEGLVERLPFGGALRAGRFLGGDLVEPLRVVGVQPFLLGPPGFGTPVVGGEVGGRGDERDVRGRVGLAGPQVALPCRVDPPAGPVGGLQRRPGDPVVQLTGLEALPGQEVVELPADGVPRVGDLLEGGGPLVELPLDLGQDTRPLLGEPARQRLADGGLLGVVPGRGALVPLAVRPPGPGVLVEQPGGLDGLRCLVPEPVGRLPGLLLQAAQFGRGVGGLRRRGAVGGVLLPEFREPLPVPRPKEGVPTAGVPRLAGAGRCSGGAGAQGLREGPGLLVPRVAGLAVLLAEPLDDVGRGLEVRGGGEGPRIGGVRHRLVEAVREAGDAGGGRELVGQQDVLVRGGDLLVEQRAGALPRDDVVVEPAQALLQLLVELPVVLGRVTGPGVGVPLAERPDLPGVLRGPQTGEVVQPGLEVRVRLVAGREGVVHLGQVGQRGGFRGGVFRLGLMGEALQVVDGGEGVPGRVGEVLGGRGVVLGLDFRQVRAVRGGVRRGGRLVVAGGGGRGGRGRVRRGGRVRCRLVRCRVVRSRVAGCGSVVRARAGGLARKY